MAHASPHPARTAAALTAGILALSSAAILIRLAGEAPSLTIALWRVALSAALMLPFALFTSAAPNASSAAPGTPSTTAITAALRSPAAIVGGVALALHFWTWMHSLTLTSVASSTLFVTTTPFWIALASPWLPHEARPTPRVLAGMGVCFAGGVVLASASSATGPVSAAGLAWATAGAWLAATYLVAARAGRQTHALPAFAFAANLVAALTLLPIALVTNTPLGGWATGTWLAIVALAVLPQLIGHNALLWAVRTTGAAIVALAVLTEPVGATLLAWGFLHETPSPRELVGGALLLGGLALAVARRREDPQAQSPAAPSPTAPPHERFT